MVSVFSSENMMVFAYFSALSVTVVVLLMILRILVHRIELVLYRRRLARFKARWKPAFTGCIIDAASCTLDMIPTLAKGECLMFLAFWNNYQESLSGFAYERLNGMARRLKVSGFARKLLANSAIRQRLLATVFLGNIRDRESWQVLAEQLHDDNALLSIQAARSLAQIDLDRALPLIFAEHLRRDDWQGAQVAAVLRNEMRADISTPHLTTFLQTCNDAEAEKLLPFMDYMYHEDRSQYLRFLIKKSSSAHLIARLLNSIHSAENLELVRDFVDHEQWYIRNQAVAALGRLGGRGDLPLLVKRLGDEQWWVRYRAAQGLARILQGHEEELAAIRDSHEDRYARQMIDQALAEGRFGHHESV